MVEKFGNNTTQVSQETIDRHFAVSLEHNDEFFDQLVEMGANVNLNRGQALIMAVKDNNLVRMELLLKHGADPTVLGKYPLKLAVKNENLKALELMCQYRQNMKDNEIDLDLYCDPYKLGRTTWVDPKILFASFNEIVIGTNNLELVKKLLPELHNGNKRRNLLFAIKTANLEMVKFFVPQKIDAELMIAALCSNSLEILQFMLSQCDDKLPENTIYFDGESSTAHILGYHGCCETLKYLIDMPRENRNLSDERTWNFFLKRVFEEAIRYRHIETIKLLKQYTTASDVHADQMFKNLEKIQQDDVFSVVEVLIEYQIAEDKDYERIAKEAARYGRTDVLELLENHGISYDPIELLHVAIIYKSSDAIKYLLAKEEVVLTRKKIIELLEYVRRYLDNDYETTKMLMMKEESSSKSKE